MKKLVMLVTVVLTVAMAAVCFAAGDGNDLNKQQKIVDKFVAALTVAAARRLCRCCTWAMRWGCSARAFVSEASSAAARPSVGVPLR